MSVTNNAQTMASLTNPTGSSAPSSEEAKAIATPERIEFIKNMSLNDIIKAVREHPEHHQNIHTSILDASAFQELSEKQVGVLETYILQYVPEVGPEVGTEEKKEEAAS
ncbi:MAG: hypothetical protein ACRYGG_12275 [Janthinobacterium lividum]